MKIRRALLKSGVLAVSAIAAGGALWWESGPAKAQTLAWNTSLVSVRGIVSGSPESVSFSGTVKVGTRLAPDPDFGAPSLVVSIDLSGVSGVGSSTQAKYVIAGPEIVQRRLAPSYTVDITFPFYRSGTDGTRGARSGAASFSLNVNTATGAVTSATGSIASSSL